MRPRFFIFILVIVLLIVVVLFWRHPAHPSANSEQAQTTGQSTNAPQAQSSPVRNAPSATPSPSANQTIAQKGETPEQAKREIESANLPVDFFGLVIDQNSNPIPGVIIKSGVRHWEMPDISHLLPGAKILGASRDIPMEATTGPDGRFELTGASGDVFGVLLFKDGYDAESEKNGFGAGGNYSYENPVVFKMWPTNLHEDLISGKKSFHVVPDGRPYFINLTNSTISESGTGDLKVWIKRPTQITYGSPYDWSCEVDVINGGLQATSDYAMWMAPANGYTPSFQFEQSIGSGWGDSTGERRFYVTLNNGQEYGKITIELYAYYNNQIPGLVRLSYAINPSGSRILR
jgi:hypothetical protein